MLEIIQNTDKRGSSRIKLKIVGLDPPDTQTVWLSIGIFLLFFKIQPAIQNPQFLFVFLIHYDKEKQLLHLRSCKQKN